MTPNCPYCGAVVSRSSDNTRKRHPLQELLKCAECGKYSVMAKSRVLGAAFHLSDPLDPDSAAIRRG